MVQHIPNEEPRFHALGRTDENRRLHLTFTLRGEGTLIRVISMSERKTPPEFETEAEERAFWESQDSTEYVDWERAQSASFPNLKPSTKTISLRLPEGLLERIKIEAHKRDMPYQSLIKAWLAEDVERGREEGSKGKT